MAEKKVLADLSDEELIQDLGDSQRELYNVRSTKLESQNPKIHLEKMYKKTIARILTEKRRRELLKAL